MTEKNRLFMGIRGRKIDINLTAPSEERAQKIYEAIEKLLIEAIRIDLESEWKRDDD